jgi:hypothetical protein
VLDRTAGVSGQFLFLTLDPYTVLFLAGVGLPIAAALLLRGIRTDSGFSATEFAGMFLQGNPLLAAESLIRYGRARDEQETVSVTERLGQAKSRLTVEELLEALADPRFNVRFEAVLALARMPADPRVLEALATIVAGEEPALSVVAAWALGRLGDERGAPALRAGLQSPYRSVQAHSARALGTLEDEASADELLARFERERDDGLRLAYASALAKLGRREVTEGLLAFLRTRTEASARMELALDVVRLMGDEHHFIQLWRRMHGEAGTALAQALLGLQKRLERVLPAPGVTSANGSAPNGAAAGEGQTGEALTHLTEAMDAFAHNDLDEGARHMAGLIGALPGAAFDTITLAVLRECAARLQTWGAERQEYLLLAVHGLHTGLMEGVRREA